MAAYLSTEAFFSTEKPPILSFSCASSSQFMLNVAVAALVVGGWAARAALWQPRGLQLWGSLLLVQKLVHQLRRYFRTLRRRAMARAGSDAAQPRRAARRAVAGPAVSDSRVATNFGRRAPGGAHAARHSPHLFGRPVRHWWARQCVGPSLLEQRLFPRSASLAFPPVENIFARARPQPGHQRGVPARFPRLQGLHRKYAAAAACDCHRCILAAHP